MTKTFEEPNALNDVADFHKTFKLPINSDPEIPSADRCRLRINLIEEEVNELKDAIKAGDLVEVADAFADIQYVLAGAILEFGMGNKFNEIFKEVQRSNMSKVCKSLEEAEATQKHYVDTKDTASYIEKSGDDYLVYRTEDGKVLKSVNYSSADIGQFL